MMGFQGTLARLVYDFCLDEHVPFGHMLRGIDRRLDLNDLRQSLEPFYSQMGRPSVDPELMIRMLIVGCSMGIRSERRLCEEVHLNLAYRRFCRLGLCRVMTSSEPGLQFVGGRLEDFARQLVVVHRAGHRHGADQRGQRGDGLHPPRFLLIARD
jgi:transposase